MQSAPILFLNNVLMGFTSCPLRCASGVLREGRGFERYAARAHSVFKIVYSPGFTSCPLRCASGLLREGRGFEVVIEIFKFYNVLGT